MSSQANIWNTGNTVFEDASTAATEYVRESPPPYLERSEGVNTAVAMTTVRRISIMCTATFATGTCSQAGEVGFKSQLRAQVFIDFRDRPTLYAGWSEASYDRFCESFGTAIVTFPDMSATASKLPQHHINPFAIGLVVEAVSKQLSESGLDRKAAPMWVEPRLWTEYTGLELTQAAV